MRSLPRACCIAATLCMTAVPVAAEPAEATAASYASEGERLGVVLLEVFWGRRWRCGRFENAQLLSLGFDLVADAARPVDAPPDFLLEGPWRLTAPNHWVPYAYMLKPGEYQAASFEVGFARSRTDVGRHVAKRDKLIEAGKSKAGSFTVAAGEIVYLGNFGPDCAEALPIPWRYFMKQGPDFTDHLASYKQKYPFLPTDRVVYRLFQTTLLGMPSPAQ